MKNFVSRKQLVSRKIGIANAVTVSGWLAGMGWVIGGPAWLAAYSIIADEADGYIARSLNEQSQIGADLDYSVDIALAGAVAVKMGGLWPFVLMASLPFQSIKHSKDGDVPFASLRAIMMSAALTRK